MVRGEDFTTVIRNGSVAADGVLVVFVLEATDSRGGSDAKPRLGVTIPKKVGNAVCRNGWKRWIRESFRLSQHELPRGYDIVVRPKKGASPSWTAIESALPRLVRKAVQRRRRDS